MRKRKVLIVLGSGGHTAQMLRLVDLLGNRLKYEYIVLKDDPLSEKKIKIKGKVWKITRPRDYNTSLWKAVFKTMLSFFESIKIVLKSNACAIISAGPGIAVPLCYVGKFFGKKIIFIESWSRIWNLSRTGKLVYPISDLFFVQWEYLKNKYPKSIYAGRLG